MVAAPPNDHNKTLRSALPTAPSGLHSRRIAHSENHLRWSSSRLQPCRCSYHERGGSATFAGAGAAQGGRRGRGCVDAIRLVDEWARRRARLAVHRRGAGEDAPADGAGAARSSTARLERDLDRAPLRLPVQLEAMRVSGRPLRHHRRCHVGHVPGSPARPRLAAAGGCDRDLRRRCRSRAQPTIAESDRTTATLAVFRDRRHAGGRCRGPGRCVAGGIDVLLRARSVSDRPDDLPEIGRPPDRSTGNDPGRQHRRHRMATRWSAMGCGRAPDDTHVRLWRRIQRVISVPPGAVR